MSEPENIIGNRRLPFALIIAGIIVLGAFATTTASPATQTHAIVFFISGNLATGTTSGNINILAGFALTCTKVTGYVNTVATGATIKVNVLFGGSTIFVTSTELTIPINTHSASVTLTGNDVTALALGTDVTINIDQIGNVVPGADLVVQVVC